MKVSEKELRKIIREERDRLIRESITDTMEYEGLMEKYANQISDNFGEDMMSLYRDEPEAFEGQSRDAWEQQVVYAQQELDTGIVEAILRVVQEVEMKLHDGEYNEDY